MSVDIESPGSGYSDADVLYVDTDSIFWSAVPLVKHRDKNANISDNEYMTEYLHKCGKDLHVKNPETINEMNELKNKYTQNMSSSQFVNDEIYCSKSIADSISKLFYKPLAKLLHPDKKQNSNSDDFIKLNTAYEQKDYLTLFLFHYENKVNIDITEEIIKILDMEIQKKIQEIATIQKRIYWQWNISDDNQKKLIEEFVKHQL